jgi:hypothetical protein
MEKGLEQFDFMALHIFRPAEVKPTENIFNESQSGFFKRLFANDSGSSNTEKTPIGAEILAEAMVSAAQSGKEGVNYYNSNQILKLLEKGKTISVIPE